MKNLLILFALLIPSLAFAQQVNYNNQGGYIADGYDVVSYFDGKPLKGDKAYSYDYNGAKLLFANSKNLNRFMAAPSRYMPQYGGWCAYALASGKLVSINPKTYEIRDGKLYLFYNRFFSNSKEDWLEEGPNKLKQQADKNWENKKYKK